MPRPGQVLGLVGTNGIGKSTALKILSGKLKPNLGRYENPPDWEEILKYFRGSDLQSTFIFGVWSTAGGSNLNRLFHQGSGGQLEGGCEASVCGSNSQGCQGVGQEGRRPHQGPRSDGQHGTRYECSWYVAFIRPKLPR